MTRRSRFSEASSEVNYRGEELAKICRHAFDEAKASLVCMNGRVVLVDLGKRDQCKRFQVRSRISCIW
ncbi:MAG: hypothetical protein V3V11_09580, partial [Vicinamibacteria bacterium]